MRGERTGPHLQWSVRLTLSVREKIRHREPCGWVLSARMGCGTARVEQGRLGTLLGLLPLIVACAAEPPGADATQGTNGDANGQGACATPLVAPGEFVEIEIEHDEVLRTYWLYVGLGADLSQPSALLLNFHGLTSNPERQRAMSDMTTTADERGVFVAYPRGISKSFNAGSCCGEFVSPVNDADDVGFSRAIVKDISERACVDRRRVYSTGMSNGGYMSEYNGCEAADLFAAIAPVSAMGLPQTSCTPSRAIPLIAFNGTDDVLVSHEDSQASLATWVARNGCSDGPVRETHGESYCDAWTDCRERVEVVACTIQGMNHCWPGTAAEIGSFCDSSGPTDISASEMIWEFFDRFKLPD
jgi:polyhydroxybutyrate depolymerase